MNFIFYFFIVKLIFFLFFRFSVAGKPNQSCQRQLAVKFSNVFKIKFLSHIQFQRAPHIFLHIKIIIFFFVVEYNVKKFE